MLEWLQDKNNAQTSEAAWPGEEQETSEEDEEKEGEEKDEEDDEKTTKEEEKKEVPCALVQLERVPVAAMRPAI